MLKTTLVLLAACLAPVVVIAQHEGHLPAPTPSAAAAEHAEHHGSDESEHKMKGLFGPYPMSREASGTSWQPESTPMGGYQLMSGPWMLMIHATADAVYDKQGGPRGERESSSTGRKLPSP